MTLLYVAGALSALLPAVLAPVVVARLGPAVTRSRVVERLRRAIVALVATIGRVPTAAAVMLASSGGVIAVCWPLGEALASLEGTVDRAVFDYVTPRHVALLERLCTAYTGLGDRAPLYRVSIVAAVVFAVLWRRRWWIPVVAMLGQFWLERYLQQILALTVDRGHPPTGLGTYPSGGVARIVLTFGTLALLAALTWRPRAVVRTAMGAAVAVAALLEGYTRIYVGKHWTTDVVGGLVFGPLLLVGVLVAVTVLAGRLGPTADVAVVDVEPSARQEVAP